MADNEKSAQPRAEQKEQFYTNNGVALVPGTAGWWATKRSASQSAPDSGPALGRRRTTPAQRRPTIPRRPWQIHAVSVPEVFVGTSQSNSPPNAIDLGLIQ